MKQSPSFKLHAQESIKIDRRKTDRSVIKMKKVQSTERKQQSTFVVGCLELCLFTIYIHPFNRFGSMKCLILALMVVSVAGY